MAKHHITRECRTCGVLFRSPGALGEHYREQPECETEEVRIKREQNRAYRIRRRRKASARNAAAQRQRNMKENRKSRSVSIMEQEAQVIGHVTVRAEWKFCAYCGTQQSKMWRYCAGCGASRVDSALTRVVDRVEGKGGTHRG